MTKMNISRRGFIVTTAIAGGGMALGFHIPSADAAAGVAAQPWRADAEGVEVNAWLTIDADGIVTIRVPHTDMGQGALTAVAMMAAEELDVPWENVRAVFADPNRHVNNGEEYVTMSTGGSNTVRLRHPHIMQAGASARERLKEAAAQAWGVSRADVTARQGELSAGDHTGTYAEFATAAAEITLDEEPAIKAPGDWWLLGNEVSRLDVPLKVNGSAHYAIDTQVEGMVYAAVKASPVPWGRLVSYDFEAIRNRPGVIAAIELEEAAEGELLRPDDTVPNHTNIQSGVAVIADSWYRAKTALDLMPIEWDFGESGEVSNATFQAEADRLLGEEGEVIAEIGSETLALIDSAEEVITAEYHRPYEAHARMEPVNATAHVTEDRVDLWTPIQNQAEAVRLAADQLGRDTTNVHVHTVFLGGGFGGNGGGGTAVTRQAVELSRQVGSPVKVIWSREEDLLNGKHRPPAYGRFSAVLGEDGLPTALFTRVVGEVYSPGYADRNVADMPYAAPNRRHERHVMPSHIPSTWHRAPGANQNGFMVESFADELALAGGWDPLEWRLAMTRDRDDYQLVLNTLKEVSGFTTDLPQGEGMGVAVVESHGTIAAACATVSVSRRGQLAVEKIDVVVDSGHVINPLNSAEQIEGAVAWELSHALMGGLDIRNGRVMNTNFDTYNLLRIHGMPEINVHFALSGGDKWGGMGEPSGPPTPPAVANAIYFATGKRLRSTPFNAHDLSWR